MMATTELRSLWQAAFPERVRPVLISGDQRNEDGFLPLANPKDFAIDINQLSHQQLFAVASNNQIALKEAQDEYIELERQINIIRHPDPTTLPAIKNPQTFPDHDEFEDRKEALLYNYKYEVKRYPDLKKLSEMSEQEKRDLRVEQDAFHQGGFVPNARQYQAQRIKAKDPRNPDGWVPVQRNGRKLLPKLHQSTRDQKTTVTRSKAAALLEAKTRAGTEDIDDVSARSTPGPATRLMRTTRFNGTKVPITREASEDPSYPPSRASTPKRKRGDTPLPSIEDGSPLKRIRAVGPDSDPPRRRRHNQYTKAKELRSRGETEGATTTQSAKETSRGRIGIRLFGPYDQQDQNSSRASTADPPASQTPSRKRRHNQYTKAKERAEQIATTETNQVIRDGSQVRAEQQSFGSIPQAMIPNGQRDPEFKTHHAYGGAVAPDSIQYAPPIVLRQPTEPQVNRIKFAHRQPAWATMTPEEKLHHKWDSESLIAAIRDDYTWLPEEGDQAKRAERDRLLAQKNPHRSFSIKNKWRFWKAEGLDKRPRKNKAVSGLDGSFTADDTMSTPGPMSEADMAADHDNNIYASNRPATASPGLLGEASETKSITGIGNPDRYLGLPELDGGIRRSGRAR